MSDTEATITGNKTCVFRQIQNRHPEINFEPCRIHVLDLILKHLSTPSKKNGRSESSIENVAENFNFPKNEERRDDYRFLLKLVITVEKVEQRMSNQICTFLSSQLM